MKARLGSWPISSDVPWSEEDEEEVAMITALLLLALGMCDALVLAGQRFSVATSYRLFSQGQLLDHLEGSPYHSTASIPMNTFKPNEPHRGRIVDVRRLAGTHSGNQVFHITVDHDGKMPFWEGQNIGVVPPGIHPKTNKPHANRLYSIASTRYGDDMKGRTVSFCVRRVAAQNDQGEEDASRKGICSNFLCDTRPGDEVLLTGPAGRIMLLPEHSPAADLILVATGTGVAPYRGFLRRLFVESTLAARNFRGHAWLILGVADQSSILYADEWMALEATHPSRFRASMALSREQRNANGGKLYVQDRLEEAGDEIFDRMARGAHIYFCGLRGMMAGSMQSLERVAARRGCDWPAVLKQWKERGQWHVEVY